MAHIRKPLAWAVALNSIILAVEVVPMPPRMPSHRRFHRVISRFGVMFFDDPRAGFANLRNATGPDDGRLVVAVWQPRPGRPRRQQARSCGACRVYSTGTYTDHLRRDDGAWRIADRLQTIDPSWRGTPPPPVDPRPAGG
jgi:hypothetical protein